MNILVIGGGGREHALVWKLAASPLVSRIYATPGNPGIAQYAEIIPSGDTSPNAFLQAAQFAQADLTIVGPEAPLVAGVVDAFLAAGRKIVGPSAAAARLEGSKVYAKQFLRDHGIPTADFVNAHTTAEALTALRQFSYPVVIKADGLAAGKGVHIAEDPAQAEAAIAALGAPLVIEEFLYGEEVSFIALSDGRDAIPLEPAQDHKQVFDQDQGPNTGGMGAYSDSRILTPEQTSAILDTVIRPTIDATAFTGFLYAGLMMTAHGPKLLEFNVRLGDPETQPLMQRMTSDFVPALQAAASGTIGSIRLDWNPGPSVCVVLASGGYPGKFAAGFPIRGIEDAEAAGAKVFHAGTRYAATGVETAGGRVLGVTASGSNLREAIGNAYAGANHISFEHMHYRRDIGSKGLKRYN